MKKLTWKPIAAGALDINAGIVSTILAVSLIFIVLGMSDQISNVAGLIVPAVIVIVAAAVMVIGGLYTYIRQHFWLAVAGSACAIIVVLGIPALILVILSKSEFVS